MRRLSYFIIALLAIAALASAQILKSQNGTSDTKFQTLKVGAGGYVTGLNIARDGTKVVRTDTYGAYLFNGSAPNPGNDGGTGTWQQLVTINSMPPADARFGNHAGVYEIAIAPNDSTRIYMYINGYVYKSVNRGRHSLVRLFSKCLSIRSQATDILAALWRSIPPMQTCSMSERLQAERLSRRMEGQRSHI